MYHQLPLFFSNKDSILLLNFRALPEEENIPEKLLFLDFYSKIIMSHCKGISKPGTAFKILEKATL